MSVTKTADKNGIQTYVISCASGASAEIVTYGARINKLLIPDKNGNFLDIVAGYEEAEGYKGENPYFNAIIGRVANRIGNAEFTLNGKKYVLCKNDAENCLHGGKIGFDRRIFKAEIPDEDGNSVALTYVSPDGEEGFPSELTLTVTYTLTDKNELIIDYSAESDGNTVFNPTNHAYFNLDGDFDSVLDTEVCIKSEKKTVSDENLICDGKILALKNTPFDFSEPKTIGRDIKTPHPYFENARGGYDFNYVLDKNRDASAPVAYAVSHKSGIKMDVYTDRPCLQLYTGNFLDGSITGKHVYGYQSAFCMETQGYPNACNVPSFPSIKLQNGEKFDSRTKYAFSVISD